MSTSSEDKGDEVDDLTAKFVEAEIERQAEEQVDDGVEADRADAFVARALAEVIKYPCLIIFYYLSFREARTS